MNPVSKCSKKIGSNVEIIFVKNLKNMLKLFSRKLNFTYQSVCFLIVLPIAFYQSLSAFMSLIKTPISLLIVLGLFVVFLFAIEKFFSHCFSLQINTLFNKYDKLIWIKNLRQHGIELSFTCLLLSTGFSPLSDFLEGRKIHFSAPIPLFYDLSFFIIYIVCLINFAAMAINGLSAEFNKKKEEFESNKNLPDFMD